MRVQDSEKIARGIAVAKAEGREIDDLTAKIIAAQYHDGGGRTLAFLSTGTILPFEGIPGPVSTLWRAFAGEYASHTRAEREALDWLGTYLQNRESHGEVGGWVDLSW
jgi:hypothetical protein